MSRFLDALAKRYIAGKLRQDAIAACVELNRAGLSATIDNLGENTKTENHAKKAVEEYLLLLDDIKRSGVNASVSMKLTHMGLDISERLAYENSLAIIKHADKLGNFVRVDMESSLYTQRTIDIVQRLHKKYSNVGVAIQTALVRSEKDIRLLIKNKISVRLVKGAYKEPADIAYEDKRNVDESYSKLMKEIILKGERPAIATHDEVMIDEVKKIVEENKIPREKIEFQMLLGIKRKLQKELSKQGYQMRVYVPYGPEWLPYIMRRFTERKENIWFVVKHLFD